MAMDMTLQQLLRELFRAHQEIAELRAKLEQRQKKSDEAKAEKNGATTLETSAIHASP